MIEERNKIIETAEDVKANVKFVIEGYEKNEYGSQMCVILIKELIK